MPEKDQIVRDCEGFVSDLERLHEWLRKVYYSDDFSTFFNRPVLSLLIAAVLYLIENLNALKQKYQMGASRLIGG